MINSYFVVRNTKSHKILLDIIFYGYIVIMLSILFLYYLPGMLTHATLGNSFISVGMFLYFQHSFLSFIEIIIYSNLEYFYIYNTRIEAKANGDTKNIAVFKSIKEIREVKLITGKIIYIFDDGRKDSLFNKCKFTCLNHYNYNLRIPKTKELEDFIITNMEDKLKRL